MRKNCFMALGLMLLTSTSAIAQNSSLCINEIMQSNIDNYMFEHDFPDSWVELYNPTSSAINIQNYYIGLNSSYKTAYKITKSVSVPAKGYLIICCDKVANGIHTNFRLESVDPGELYLFNSTGSIVDKISYPAMPAPNIAYGRETDGAATWGWELKPTPKTPNKGGVTTQILPNPIFSMNGQVMSSSAKVKITLPQGDYPSDTRIYVTTDGSEPTTASQHDKEFTFTVNSTTILRAKLISASAISPRSVTQSYIFHPRNTNIPIISIVSDSTYFYSDKEGILSDAETSGKKNYTYDWRRPVNAEYLGVQGETPWFNQVGEIALAGNVSRTLPQKSLKLYANKRFGTKKLKGQFWQDKPDVTKVKSFMIRNGGNNMLSARVNDAAIQRIFGTHLSNLDYQAYSPIITYINGVYKGVYGLRERSNEDYVESNYNGLEDIELVSHRCYIYASERKLYPLFTELYNKYTSSTTTYEQMANLIDVENFMNAMITEMFTTNHDYPHNNISMWRPTASDGKWRWILKDLDFFAISQKRCPVEFNMFRYMLKTSNFDKSVMEDSLAMRTDTKYATKIYHKMMSFPEFRERFIDAFTVYLGDFLKPTITESIIRPMVDEIREEVYETVDYYNRPDRKSEFEVWSGFLIQNTAQRQTYSYQHMAEWFSLGTVIPMTVKRDGREITINGIGLTEGDFDGAFFSNRKLTLSSQQSNIGWKMTTYKKSNGKMVEGTKKSWDNASVSLTLKDYANCDSVAFEAFVSSENDFEIKLSQLKIDYNNCKDWSNEATIAIAEPLYAYANISGITALPTSKNDNLHATIDFYDNNGNFLRKKIILNKQGSSEPKSNLSISFCEDDWIGDETTSLTFGNWVPQDEFHLKGFYEDGLRGTAEVAYELYGNITQRDRCYPDAFPLSIYVNGDFYGVMAWQIKKHRDNMGLDKKNASNVWIDGTLNDKQLFQGDINWTKFEIRNPKDLYNMDGSDYDGDAPQEIIDATSPAYTGKTKMVRTAEAKQNIINLSNYCSEIQDLEDKGKSMTEIKNAIKARFDVPELVNYMVFSLVTNNYDGFSKNWQWFTYDGKQWTVAPYDCNLTFGYNEEGISLWEAEQSSKKYDYRMSNADTSGPMRWIRTYFWDDVKARYSTLRKSKTIDVANITKIWQSWHDRIGSANYKEEWKRWPNSPIQMGGAESSTRFKQWITTRIDLLDIYLGYKTETTTYELAISDAEWATICVPFAFDIPAEIDVYSVIGVSSDGETLVFNTENSTIANKPYLVNGPSGTYNLSGTIAIGSPSESGYLVNGLLTGTLDKIYAPAGSYVLQHPSSGIGFYYVREDNTITVPEHRAYLSIMGSSNSRFRLSDDATGIHTLSEKPSNDEMDYYNLMGQKIDEKATGLYIIKNQTGKTSKIIVK